MVGWGGSVYARITQCMLLHGGGGVRGVRGGREGGREGEYVVEF